MGVNRVKEADVRVQAVVAVIASAAALAQATRLRRSARSVRTAARHAPPLVGEGGPRNPETARPAHSDRASPGGRRPGRARPKRAASVCSNAFLEHAAFIDLELRSLKQMRTLIQAAQRQHVASHSFLARLPWHSRRVGAAPQDDSAASAGAAIFKVATRTETPAELARLISLFQTTPPTTSDCRDGNGKARSRSRRPIGAARFSPDLRLARRADHSRPASR